MGTPRSPASDFYGIYGISKTACKAYKSLVMKLHHHPSHHKTEPHSDVCYIIQENRHNEKSTTENDPITLRGFRLHSMDDSSVFKRRSSFLSRTGSRRSHTPQARPTYLSSASSSHQTTTFFQRTTSQRNDNGSLLRGLKSRPFSKSTNPHETDDTMSTIRGVTSPLSSPRERDGFISPINGLATPSSPVPDNLSGSARQRDAKSPNVSPIKGVTSSSQSSLSKSVSRRERDDVNAGKECVSSSVPLLKSTSMGLSERESASVGVMGRSMSRRTSTPIVFSQSVARRKPPPIERKLECTLEELCHGGIKNIKITRDVLTNEGLIAQEEETLRVNIKPGWKKGIKITFEGRGNEKPGYLPEDIIFLIEEKRHPLFKKRGDDLEIAVEIPLLKALTGCTLSVPLLGGEKMALSIEDVIFHGFEKAIPGQGMPNAKEEGKRGDLKITFLVNFPEELSDERRAMAYEILKDCSWS